MDHAALDIYTNLADWFRTVSVAVNDTVFGIAPDPDSRKRVMVNSLRRNANLVAENKTENGPTLFTPVVLIMCALAELVEKNAGVSTWEHAAASVFSLRRSLGRVTDKSAFSALNIGRSSDIFLGELVSSLANAGHIYGRDTVLTDENREMALAHSLSWARRYLLAAGLELYTSSKPPSPPTEENGLLWIGWQTSQLAERLQSE